jgi:predicted RNA-binding Zn-ribbon protein involved in translation (DUF1610 family)
MNEEQAENHQTPMPSPDEVETQGIQVSERDVVFACPRCHGDLVVDRDGAGMVLDCAFCGQSVTVPPYEGASLLFLQAATAKLANALEQSRQAAPKQFSFSGKSSADLAKRRHELQRLLRDTHNQLNEYRGFLNHSKIQVHRYHLKVEMMETKLKEVRAELAALEGSE